MKRSARLASTLRSRLVSAALAAVPIVVFALAGCGGDVNAGTTGGQVDNSVCSASDPCEVGKCTFSKDSCAADALGKCQNGYNCDGPPSGPICGCDGKTVEGEYPGCASSIRQDKPEACQVGTFACGPTLSCTRNNDVCVVRIPGVPGPSTYECLALDATENYCLGGIPACNCLDVGAIGGGASCQEDADFQDTVTVAMP